MLLWELWTMGAVQPYAGLNLRGLLAFVLDGQRLPQPDGCSDVVYALMRDCCWCTEPMDRASFETLRDRLASLAADGAQRDLTQLLMAERGASEA